MSTTIPTISPTASPTASRPDLHRRVIEAATLAPSVHNTQPWRFTSTKDGLDLWADPGRRLPVLDPDGRQVHLSCGAALQHACVAARALGLDAVVQLLPDAARPTLLARLGLSAGRAATADELGLAEAVTNRHTHRDAFDGRSLPRDLLGRMRADAEDVGAWLHPVADEGDLLELEVLLSRADRAEEADPAYRSELADWVRADGGADGIPPGALPADAERGSSLRLRDFSPGAVVPRTDGPPVAERPDVVLLLSADDTALSWLRTGQALGAVVLRAAAEGVQAQPLGQVTDLPASRRRLGHALGLLGTPQLALRMGYPAAGTAPPAARATPRRTVEDVMSATRPRPAP